MTMNTVIGSSYFQGRLRDIRGFGIYRDFFGFICGVDGDTMGILRGYGMYFWFIMGGYNGQPNSSELLRLVDNGYILMEI